MHKKISIYIHIPFCKSKCNYCTFNSYPLKIFSKELISHYFKFLKNQILQYKDLLQERKIISIYFGGGTPSVVEDRYIHEILNTICKNYNILEECEITIEINPETVNHEKLKNFKEYGINRISIGIQSFNDNLLKFLGRIHSSKQAIKSIETAKRIFKNVSIDLMYGIPYQNIKILEDDLKKAVSFDVEHISCYCLSIEENSILAKKGIKEISDNTFNKMYDYLVNFLNKNNYIQYEISNFSKKGYESKHNLNYWNYGEYIGFGAGAFSFFNNKRWKNKSFPEDFIKNPDIPEFQENIDKKTMEFEYIFLNLRKTDGIDLDEYRRRFRKNFIIEYRKILQRYKEYFIINRHSVRLNLNGFKISNTIFSDFI